jgi:hypothetical protein
LAFLAVFLSSCPLRAQAPGLLGYQGVLTDAAGAAVADGSYDITFAIYEAAAGGSPLWSETQAVTVQKGIFNALLGSTVALGLAFDRPYYVGISVEGRMELAPRTPLTSSPYAFSSRSVAGTSNVFPAAGNVGIGVVPPLEKLHVGGAVTLGAAAGYVLVLGTTDLIINHTSGSADFAIVGLSDWMGGPAVGQSHKTQIASGIPSGEYSSTVCTHWLFKANDPGTYAFFLLGYENTPGSFQAYECELTLVYLPTSYGPTIPGLRAPLDLNPAKETGSGLTEADIARERAETESYNEARIRRELDAMSARIAALKEELGER